MNNCIFIKQFPKKQYSPLAKCTHYSFSYHLELNNWRRVWFIALALLILLPPILKASDSTAYNKKRFTALVTTTGTLYTVGMLGLGQVWYKEQLTNSFTFFNDNGEWNYMDKMGHFYTSFLISDMSVHMLKWSGCSHKKSIWYGGLTGAALMLPIEVFDGFSAEYGASWGDLTANTLGSAAVISQYLLWDEIRIMPKFSYHHSQYAELRPNTLGSTPTEQLIKDYNGQTYWLSFNIASLTHSQKIPKWFNLSLGYGANGMIYAEPSENIANGYTSYSQVFLGLDIDLTRIKTKSKFLKTVFYGLNYIRLPLPALEYNGEQGFIFHPLYF